MYKSDTHRQLEKLLRKRILVLDGASGTMIQKYNLSEEDFRGDMFQEHLIPLQGNNDLLVLTRPHIIQAISEEYLIAGANIISTCSFNGNAISQMEYQLPAQIYDLNYHAAQILVELKNRYNTPEQPRFIAGSIGPTSKTLSMSPNSELPDYRNINFDELVVAYREQIRGLVDGGSDILLIETIFDTLNAKAALFAVEKEDQCRGYRLPVMISGTITDASGRIFTGQTIEAFIHTLSFYPLLSMGLNCGLGVEQMRAPIEAFSNISPFFVSMHANAGLPNALGGYDETPKIMAQALLPLVEQGKIHIIGGCCGTTPAHIAEITKIISHVHPKSTDKTKSHCVLCGLETVDTSKKGKYGFTAVGERTNVAGSLKFAKLIRDENYREALQIARRQIIDGAQIIDICMDDAMLETEKTLTKFIRYIHSEPDIVRVPLMVDSSSFKAIISALKNIQGKPIVNSISLKNGEQEFLESAKAIKEFGAAVVVMLFDEEGQADIYERKISIAQRAYSLLTEKLNFPAHDIIFDPNILTIGTGIDQHNNYAVDFLNATKWIKNNLPYAMVSGGVSNLSFAFRGNNAVREAMHSIFLHHAQLVGLDMAIVNPTTLISVESIPKKLAIAVENLIFNKFPNALENLLKICSQYNTKQAVQSATVKICNLSSEEQLKENLIRGNDYNIEEITAQVLKIYSSATMVIEKPLMEGMGVVSEKFRTGEMFLPQVVKSARVMQKAVNYLKPFILEERKTSKTVNKRKILLATVKGDVHDIGKNIVGIILACNGYDIIDLGVMAPVEKIIEQAKILQVDAVGLSGLITPSLHEMEIVAQKMEEANLRIPLLIGGATTTALHTALKIATHYGHITLHGKDASVTSIVVQKLFSEESGQFITKMQQEQEILRTRYKEKKREFVPFESIQKQKV